MNIFGLRLFLIFLTLLFSAGCGPTYPKERLAASIIELCRKEYGIKVESKVIGKTLAIYIPLPKLLDITMTVSMEAQDMIQNVILSTSRVALSTDAKIEFYCVIAQDMRMPEVQIVLIKYIDDVKRAYFSDISRDEYFKRTLFDININPQSKKEKDLKNIFEKYDMDPELKEKVLDEFFRSTPLHLEDFGYWQGRFYVKDITLPEFLAEQMAYRVKMRFRENEKLSKKFLVKDIDGYYKDISGKFFFYIYFDIKLNEILKVMGETYDKRDLFMNIFEEVSDCLYGYKFDNFSVVRITDKNNAVRLFISKEDLYAFKKGKLGVDAIMGGL